MSLLLLLLLLLFQTFAVSLVKPVKPRSMTVFPDTLNFRFRKSTTDGFTETGADTRFGFDKWITLEVKAWFPAKRNACISRVECNVVSESRI